MARKTIKQLQGLIDELQQQMIDMVENENRLIREARMSGQSMGRTMTKSKAIDLVSESIRATKKAIDQNVCEDSKLGYDEAVKVLAVERKVKILLLEEL